MLIRVYLGSTPWIRAASRLWLLEFFLIGNTEGSPCRGQQTTLPGSRTPDSRCFVEDKRQLCQLSSKRLEDNWQSGLLSTTCGLPGVEPQIVAGL